MCENVCVVNEVWKNVGVLKVLFVRMYGIVKNIHNAAPNNAI